VEGVIQVSGFTSFKFQVSKSKIQNSKFNNKYMNKIKILFSFLLLGAMFFSCNNSDNWSPASQLGPDNPGAYFDFGVTPEGVTVEPDESSFTLTLARAQNKSSAAFQLPITVVQANSNLSIPSSVTFAAGATTAELKIDITTALVLGDCLSFALGFDEKLFDPWKANASNRFNGSVCVFEKPTLGPVTPENISKYVQEADVESASVFTNRSVAAAFDVILMSPRLDAWQEDYRTLFPLFSHYSIRIRRSTAQDSFTALYTPTGLWYWGQPVDNSGMFQPMRAAGQNPLTDVTIVATRLSTSGAPTNHNSVDVNAGAVAFRDFLNQEEGFTIIQDWDNPDNIFWFRSRLDPNDWFKVERQ
jgi:hypothetical protein